MDNFEREVLYEQEALVLVFFYADWCGPCRMIAPIIDELDEQYDDDELKVIKINVDGNSQIPQLQQVLGIPTMKFYKDGEQVSMLVGASSKKHITETIDEYL